MAQNSQNNCGCAPAPNCPSLVTPVFPVQPGNCGCEQLVTKYYGLPLWQANQVTSWLVGINTAMERIDKVLHDFALRTGINGEPADYILQVQDNTANIKQLLQWQITAIKDLSQLTSVTSQCLANLELMQQKVNNLNFNYNNVDVRLQSVENTVGNDLTQQVEKLTNNLSVIQTNLTELTTRVDKLESPSTVEPDTGESSDNEEGSEDSGK